jgi:nitrogen-specific signal transduction histidine kinase
MISTPSVASADVLRTMAHELRQPLSTIESIAYYLTLVLPKDDEKVHELLARIQHLVEQSNWIVSSAQQLTDPILAAREPVQIDALIREIILARSVLGDGPVLEIDEGLPSISANRALARALLNNLLTLFRAIATAEFPATLRVFREGAGVAIELVTDAPGYKSEASLGPGATLSLDSARRIAGAHAGSIELELDPANGVRLRVMLP